MMLTALFTACAYDDGYEEMTLTNDEAREIVDRCYYQCDSLDAVDLPFDLVAIGDYAFFGSSVTSVVIPSEVTFIGVSAFNFCPNYPHRRGPAGLWVPDNRDTADCPCSR